MGKAPNGVALIAKKYGVPVIAVGGSVLNDPVKSEGCAIDACFSIMKKPCTLEEAMDITSAFENLTFTVEQIFRLIKSIKKKEI
jgi:glycerate kinase